MSYYIYEVIFMLERTKLLQKCKEVRQGVDNLLSMVEADGYNYDCWNEKHESATTKLSEEIDSFAEMVEDAECLSRTERKEYITTLMVAKYIEGFLLGTYSAKNATENCIYLTWNPLEEVN